MALTQISTDGIKNGTITGSDLATNLDLVDNQKIRFGTGNDLQIFHDGSNSHVTSGTGQFFLSSSNSNIWLRGTETGLLNTDGSEYMIRATSNGSVKLFHDNSKKFETTSTGVDILGSDTTGSNLNGDLVINNAAGTRYAVFDASHTKLNFSDNALITLGTSNDLQIYHDGSNSYIQEEGTGHLYIDSNQLYLRNADTDNVLLQTTSAGAVQIKHNGNKKFETTSNGCRLEDSVRLSLGTSDDLQIYHDGSDSYVKDGGTGRLMLLSNTFQVNSADNSEIQISAVENGAVGLYHNGSKKLETTSTGVAITGEAALTGGALKLDSHPLVSIASFTDISGGSYAARLGSTGSSTIRSTQIYGGGGHIATFDGVNVRLGIGTTTPGALLTLNQTTPELRIQSSNNNFGMGDELGRISLHGADSTSPGAGEVFRIKTESSSSIGADYTTRLTNRTGSGGGQTEVSLGNGEGSIYFATNTTGNNASVRMKVGSDGSVGIGTTSPTDKLDVNGTAIIRSNLYLNNNVYLASNKGIYFDGNTGTANHLDDYEEGTFTPVFENGLVFSTYNNNGQRGVYTKIGRFVYGTIRLDGGNVSTQNSNQIRITGLPFASINFSNGEQVGGADPFFQDGFYNANDFSGIVNNNSSKIQLVKRSDGSSLTGSDVNGGRQIRISFSYFTAS